MGRFLEYDHGRRPSMKKYYPEPHHPSASLLCKWIFGRMRETKITNCHTLKFPISGCELRE
jgi:hypothetical protein